jgi:hypothetical protein
MSDELGPELWGPLAVMAGERDGEGGLDSWSYSETTTLRMTQFEDLFPHTGSNTVHPVG